MRKQALFSNRVREFAIDDLLCVFIAPKWIGSRSSDYLNSARIKKKNRSLQTAGYVSVSAMKRAGCASPCVHVSHELLPHALSPVLQALLKHDSHNVSPVHSNLFDMIDHCTRFLLPSADDTPRRLDRIIIPTC